MSSCTQTATYVANRTEHVEIQECVLNRWVLRACINGFDWEALMSYGWKFVPDHRLSISNRICNQRFCFDGGYTHRMRLSRDNGKSRWCINSYDLWTLAQPRRNESHS